MFITRLLTTRYGNKDPQLLDWLKVSTFLFYTHTNIYTIHKYIYIVYVYNLFFKRHMIFVHFLPFYKIS